MMNKYAIRRIHLFPAAKFGCLGGLIFAVVPALLTALLIWNLISSLTSWLESVAILELPGLLPDLNLLQILNLADFLTRLQDLTALGWLLVLGLTVLMIILGTLWFTLVVLLVTVMYNLVAAVSGGLEYSADTIGPAGKVAIKTPVAPAEPTPYLASAQNSEHRWPLLPGRSTIGSAMNNTVVITGLAEAHADIWRDGAVYMFSDRSGGRSWVNGRLPQPGHPLQDGDRLRLGPYEFIFHSGLKGGA